MNSIADALVYAVTYISLRESNDDGDDDVGALESIATILQAATKEEEDALAAAAQRALEAEKNWIARPEFIKGFSAWMENIIGEGWVGNERSA
jgi:hypothetical protein